MREEFSRLKIKIKNKIGALIQPQQELIKIALKNMTLRLKEFSKEHYKMIWV